MDIVFEGDTTSNYLQSYLAVTEQLLNRLLESFDKNGYCKIYPSLDLGFPHDVVRLAGGFATGMFIEWNCRIPFVPIDTTVNVCTSSVFKLASNIIDGIEKKTIENSLDKISNSTYKLNFHRGNHFIAFATDNQSGEEFLIIHSSAAEFKKDFNGLYPVKGNWYMGEAKIFICGDRYVRYILGDKATLFYEIANQVSEFNTIRHRFIADVILNGLSPVTLQIHKHHYMMPNSHSVLIGSFLAEENEIVPFFTNPGLPIFLLKVLPTPNNKISLNGATQYLIPHGWGKMSKASPSIRVDADSMHIDVNGHSYKIDTTESLRDHPDLVLRRFSLNPDDEDYYFRKARSFFSMSIISGLEQRISFNKNGTTMWQ